jgi:ribosomal subunit interface protein
MRAQIKATGLKLTPAITDYIQAKLDMLDKYLVNQTVTNCDFEIALTTKHHQKGDIFQAEINLVLAGEHIFIQKTEADLYKAIDKVKDHVLESIKKYKDKRS